MCRRHWRQLAFKFTIVRGKIRPVNPPSIFKELPPSLFPTPPSKPRPTTAACPSSRNVLPGEHNAFQEADVIKTFAELQNKLVDNKHDFARFSIFSYLLHDCLIIQSVEFENPSCIPRVLLKIFYDFTYSAFHCGIRCTITPLSSNRVKFLKSWSVLKEALSFLNTMERTQKEEVLLEQISAMNSLVHVGDRKYEF